MKYRSKELAAGDRVVKLRTGRSVASERTNGTAVFNDGRVLSEASFQTMIAFERKRSERSRRRCLLVLVAAGECLPSNKRAALLGEIACALSSVFRETDSTGWYRKSSAVGVIFTDIVADSNNPVVPAILARVTNVLHNKLTLEQFSELAISLHCYPQPWEHELSRRPSNLTLYPDLCHRDQSRKGALIIKRAMDIFGSVIALILLAPLFLVISLAIKLTSGGPVLFRQQRVGQQGRPFICLKFRSMHVDNDATVHKQWFHNFRSRTPKRYLANDDNGNSSYKLPNDPRVSPIGKWLRRASLDELPQFINVLKGEMSLVGPRPPIPYEVDAYEPWHRGRILQAKPGITGLWQVSGRSRVSFEEMVRLDLRYARTWSIWLDVKILLQTPRAVFSGEGAY